MILNAGDCVQNASALLSMRCPGCRHLVLLETLGPDFSMRIHGERRPVIVGQRRCPKDSCRCHLFVVYDDSASKEILVSYPAETLEFDTTDIPPAITNALSEAIQCHANQCFIAAAIMVRKSLEELCRDRGAKGGNLKERIRDLGSRVVLPKELFDGLDDIRLLGNDAAHVESQEYNQIGQQELDVAIEFTKEVLKGIFQYKNLLQKLHGLKKT